MESDPESPQTALRPRAGSLDSEAWEITKRLRPLPLAKILQNCLYFDAEVFLRANDNADLAPSFLSKPLQWDNEYQL
jgi:hypothetical protein